MDTYLQNIQDTINRLFHIQSQTSSTIIISLSIFILGFISTEFIKGLNRINKRRIIKKIFLQNLNALINQIARQGKSYARFSTAFKSKSAEEGGLYSLQKIELYQIEVIKQIGYNNLFEAFFTGFKNIFLLGYWNKKRIKAFNKVWECIENAKAWQQINDSQNELMMEMVNKANSRREAALHEYFEFIAPKLFSAPRNEEIKNSILGDYLLKIFEVRHNWTKLANNTNPTIIHENFVLPIMKLDNEYKLELTEVFISSKHLQAAASGYSEMQRIMQSCRIQYAKQAVSFKLYAKLISMSMKGIS
jgi:hypothetical protein